MFRASTARLRALLALAEDVLGDSEPPFARHPHRRSVRIERARRAGAVAPRPAHCLSPVRNGPGARRAGQPRSAA